MTKVTRMQRLRFKEAELGDGFFGTEECVIRRTGIQYMNQGYGCGYVLGGFYDYAPQKPCVRKDWKLPEMEERCKMLVRSAITLGDAFMDYNPVGGPIQTETLH